MRAIWIDSKRRRITEVEVHGLEDMQERVDGLIELAGELRTGDSLYVDDEGLLKDPREFFYLETIGHPLAGNGLIVGFIPESGKSTDAKTSLESVRRAVKFMDRNTLALWMKIHG
jgi:hypothetical protein